MHLKKQQTDLAGNHRFSSNKRIEEAYIKQAEVFKSSLTPKVTLLKVSDLVVLRVTCTKIHANADDLILPSATDTCETFLDEECAAKLKEILLSDNTIERRIQDMTDYVDVQPINWLK